MEKIDNIDKIESIEKKTIISTKSKVSKKPKISRNSRICITLRQMLVKSWANAGQVLVKCLSSAAHVLSMAGQIDNIDKIESIEKI